MSPLCSQKVFTQLRRSLLSRPLLVDWEHCASSNNNVFSVEIFRMLRFIFQHLWTRDESLWAQQREEKADFMSKTLLYILYWQCQAAFFCCFERLNIWGGPFRSVCSLLLALPVATVSSLTTVILFVACFYGDHICLAGHTLPFIFKDSVNFLLIHTEPHVPGYTTVGLVSKFLVEKDCVLDYSSFFICLKLQEHVSLWTCLSCSLSSVQLHVSVLTQLVCVL